MRPTDDPEAVAWRAAVRGTYLGFDRSGVELWRQFCAACHKPLEATREFKDRSDMRCDLCAVHSQNTIPSTAFSPERRTADQYGS